MRLCDAFTQPRTDTRPDGSALYISRWRQILEAYSRVRARLFNSLELLEGTNLALYPINEATLIRWFKNVARRREVQLLMQGIAVPVEPLCSRQPIAPPQVRPVVAAELPEPRLEFVLKDDTSGQVTVRRRLQKSCTATAAAPIDAGLPVVADHPAVAQQPAQDVYSVVADTEGDRPLARTTQWRRRKAADPVDYVRKVRCCNLCQHPTGSAGHSQYKGRIYCPFVPGQLPKCEWLRLRRLEDEARKATH